MYNQEDITLVSINWNQRPAMELMLKSFAKHHPGPTKLVLRDNGSTDDSLEWLRSTDIPFVRSPINIGHEQAINEGYRMIQTRYALLVDTDVEFESNVLDAYLPFLQGDCVAAGEFIAATATKARISPWFFLYDIAKMREVGVDTFRDVEDWSYDVGSWQTEQIIKHGFTYHHIPRLNSDIDRDLVSMQYEGFRHIGKVSWDLGHHTERIGEVTSRREFILSQLEQYKDVELKDKFL